MKTDVSKLVRENISRLKPYSSARDEYKGAATLYLDANENGLGSPICFPGLPSNLNRYPDPYQLELKQAIANLKNTGVRNVFLGNGSDECIDLLYRCFCEPGKDNVIICPPTYGMYEVSANINNVEVKKALLTSDFDLDLNLIHSLVDANTKLIWICNPNNPTGNAFRMEDIIDLLCRFNGIVVVDEAYIDFSSQPSLLHRMGEFNNLVVLQTFSKAWGMAALRLGMAFASTEIVGVLNRIKPPYNINQLTQLLVLQAVENKKFVEDGVGELVDNRKHLAEALKRLTVTEKVFDSASNFILVKINEPHKVYSYLLACGIVVRDRGNIELCEGCLRITVGTKNENRLLIETLLKYEHEKVADY